jgi:beta-lactamase regulating signal transducer with metallopeptidase domain/DUF4097 and DUF4098 domain-containing protein YvlB
MSAFIPALLIKLTLILTLGILLTSALKSAAPSLRHLVLFATLASCLVLPLAMRVSPSWDVAVLRERPTNLDTDGASAIGAIDKTALPKAVAQTSTPVASITTSASTIGRAGGVSRGSNVQRAKTIGERAIYALPFVWALGFVCVLAWLTIGRIRLRRIGKTAWPLSGANWMQLLDDERREAGVAKSVVLATSSVVSTPLTWGWQNPVILLPDDADDWSKEHRRIVLRHELAHIARNDSLSQLVAGVGCAFYWFHPLVWAAERRMRAECERACDDRVVSLGTPAADYAAHLLEVARSARAFGAAGFLSVAMARPSQLEGRLLAVLSESRQRVSTSQRARRVVPALFALMLIPLAAFRAVPRPRPNVPAAGIALPQLQPIVAAARTQLQRVGVDSSFHLAVPARTGGTLTLDLKTGGRIIVTPWDRSEVAVDAHLAGRDWRWTQVTLEPSDDGAILESYFASSSNAQSSNHTFRISVPRKFNLHVNSSGGSIDISGVEGRFTGTTGGGEIEIRNASGDVDLRTGGGDIRVSDSHLSGNVSTGGGTVRIERVSGNLAGLSGSGSVNYISSSGSIRMTESGAGAGAAAGAGSGAATGAGSGAASSKRTAYSYSGIRMTTGGGDISVPEAPNGAYVTTGGGKIRVGPSGGQVYVQTGGGAIDIGPASGSVEAVTGAGDVRINLQGANDHTVRVAAGVGDVTLEVPADLNATLDLETAYTERFGRKTRIIGDFGLQTTETNTWDDSHGTPRKYVRVRQTIGHGGPVITVRTVNGDITLQRK